MRALVVGAGFAGAVAARELAEAGHDVVVIDRRNHIGGNAHDYVDEHGIRVHQYGPHLWHTNSDVAHEWVSRFTEWVPYKHRVRAMLPNGETTPLPINLDTIHAVFHDVADHVSDKTLINFLESQQVDHREITNSRQHVEASVGTTLCDLFFAPYTLKMWGMPLEALPVSVAGRIPTKLDHDPYYFPKDKHQFLPKDGYTAIFKKIFDHPNIQVVLNTERENLPQFAITGYIRSYGSSWTREQAEKWHDPYDVVFSSEPIDTYYDCDLGELPWRSIKFRTYSLPAPELLSAPVVNFTHDGPHTRVTEWKQLPNSGGDSNWTTLTFEEPCDYKENNNERYYPVKTSLLVDPNRELYKQYRERAKNDGIHFIGRCGRYVYTDMAPCVMSTLAQVKRFLAGDKIPVED